MAGGGAAAARKRNRHAGLLSLLLLLLPLLPLLPLLLQKSQRLLALPILLPAPVQRAGCGAGEGQPPAA